MALILLLPWTKSKVIGSSPDGLLLVGSGLLIGPLSRTSSVNSASPSATQPYTMLSFAAVVTSPLPILLLVWFLPLLGSRTPVRTNTLRLILQLWLIVHPILVMITCMLVMVVARVRRRGENIHPQILFYLKMWQMWGDKDLLSFISGIMEWESPPSILVTRNLNWSQRSGTGTGCVKGRY